MARSSHASFRKALESPVFSIWSANFETASLLAVDIAVELSSQHMRSSNKSILICVVLPTRKPNSQYPSNSEYRLAYVPRKLLMTLFIFRRTAIFNLKYRVFGLLGASGCSFSNIGRRPGRPWRPPWLPLRKRRAPSDSSPGCAGCGRARLAPQGTSGSSGRCGGRACR